MSAWFPCTQLVPSVLATHDAKIEREKKNNKSTKISQPQTLLSDSIIHSFCSSTFYTDTALHVFGFIRENYSKATKDEKP